MYTVRFLTLTYQPLDRSSTYIYIYTLVCARLYTQNPFPSSRFNFINCSKEYATNDILRDDDCDIMMWACYEVLDYGALAVWVYLAY